MDELRLTGGPAVLASRIRTIDRELDVLERERTESIVRGMKAPGSAAGVIRMGQDASDLRHEGLLRERADLVVRLKVLLGHDQRQCRSDRG